MSDDSLECVSFLLLIGLIILLRAHRSGKLTRIITFMQQLKYRPAILFGSLSGFISTFLLLFLLLMFTGSMSLMTLASATIDYFSYLSPGLLIVVCPIIIVIGGLGGVIGERYAKRREEEVDNTFLRSIYGIVGGSIAGLTIGGPILFCGLGAG